MCRLEMKILHLCCLSDLGIGGHMLHRNLESAIHGYSGEPGPYLYYNGILN